MEHIVVFGGTFNPIHLGHIEIVDKVSNLPFVDKVLLIPSAIPPHKVSDDLACDADRFEMCKLAVGEREKVIVSDIELLRGGKSFTIDTLTTLKNSNPDIKLSLVCGGDMIVTFKEWHRFKDILKISDIIAVRRVGIDNKEFDSAVCELVNMGAVIEVLNGEISDISSTEIKKHINNIDYLMNFLDKDVYDYIVKNNLYSGDIDGI